jgi:mutator protein MutT
MAKAARAIIIENGRLLVMFRNKQGSQYYTLVGGRVDEGETDEQAVVREVQEETGLQVTGARLVYTEDHPEPYNKQSIFLCEIAPHGEVAIQEYSEEAMLNRIDINIHTPLWVDVRNIDKLAFRTPQLQQAIAQAVKKGFPKTPVAL